MSLNSPWSPDPSKFSELADGFRVVRYITVATYAAWLWDSSVTLSDDFRLFREFRPSFTNAVYLFSRLSALAFLTATVTFLCTASPLILEGNDTPSFLKVLTDNALESKCHQAVRPMIWLSMISLPPNSLLFVIRVRAVFYDSKSTQGFFAILWLAVLAGAFIQPFCVTFTYINLFHTCIPTTVHPYCTSGSITVMVHDTMVLLAISTRILFTTFIGSWKERFKTFFSASEMPQVSRLLMRTGQQYYFVTVMVNIATLSIMLNPAFSPIYRAVSFVPNLAVYNIMACRVYRGMKLGFIEDGGKSTFIRSGAVPGRSELQFTSFHGVLPISSGGVSSQTGTERDDDMCK